MGICQRWLALDVLFTVLYGLPVWCASLDFWFTVWLSGPWSGHSLNLQRARTHLLIKAVVLVYGYAVNTTVNTYAS